MRVPVSSTCHCPSAAEARAWGTRTKHSEDTWTHVQHRLKAVLSESVYQIWLAGLGPAACRDSVLYVEAPDETRDWVNRRFGTTLTTAARSTDASIKRVELVPRSRAGEQSPRRFARLEQAASGSGVALRAGFTFEHFVIGKTNRFAHAAALTVAEMPGHAYTPLFIHGPSGVGKTHILQAIGNYLRTHDDRLKVLYATAESFTTEFVSALQRNQVATFKSRYRELDVLLLDDVHFLERKNKTAEEFLFTLDAIAGTGAQVVLTGDRSPHSMPSLGQNLKERFQGGLVVELERPDRETRLTILRKIATGSSYLSGCRKELELLAERLPPDIRMLEGALVKLTAFASLTDQPITTKLVEETLSSLNFALSPDGASAAPSPKIPHPRISLARIQQETCRSLQVDQSALLSTNRTRYIVYARQIAMYLARNLTGLSFPTIAREFGGKDHTTALYAYRKTKERLASDPDTKALVESITKRVQDPGS
jgi:chromosomal replication initiator protein